MKNLAIVAALAIGLATPAVAASTVTKATVIERDAHGHATRVSIDGKDYAVCSKTVQDECINPRAAGLDWGNRALAYWPGHPASEKA